MVGSASREGEQAPEVAKNTDDQEDVEKVAEQSKLHGDVAELASNHAAGEEAATCAADFTA